MRTKTVRISSELLSYIDAAMEQMRNEFGNRLFRYRSEVVSTAVKEFIKNHGVSLEESSAPLGEDERDCMIGCS
jgi:metal-responsive CopG/Arc/MetJ family transcriptional regulator